MQRVGFTTYDGVELAADLYLPSGADGDWASGIIVLHEFGSRKENHVEFAEQAAGAGYAALVMDLRGHGESSGEMDANIFNDVAAALQFLQTRPEVNPMSVSLRGSSLGGWLALHTGAHLRDISPVVAYSPANEALLNILMEEMAMVQRGHASPMIPDNPPRVNVNSMTQLLYRLDVAKAARRIAPRPLLLVQCEEDTVVPPYVSQRLYDAAVEPKSLWMLPGGSNSFAPYDPATNKRVLDWLTMTKPHTEKLTLADLPDD